MITCRDACRRLQENLSVTSVPSVANPYSREAGARWAELPIA